MLRVALRGVRTHLVQFALSVLAVLLGVAFVAGTFSLRAMLADTFGAIITTTIRADAYLQGAEPSASGDGLGQDADARTRIPLALVETAEAVDGVRQVLPELSGPLVLVGADGTAVANGQAPSFGTGLHPDDPNADVVAGRIPSAEGEIALESATARTAGLDVGDRTTAVIGGQVTDVVVVGEVDLGAPSAGATLVFVDVDTARTVYAGDALVSTIAIYAEDDVGEEALVDRLTRALADAGADGSTAQVLTGAQARAQATDSVNEVLGFIGTFLLVFAGISLFVGAFIIANTFTMTVRQRQREFALLRAVGAAPSQVFASVLVQAGVVGVLGSALGVLAGVGLVSILRGVLRRMGMDLSGAIPLEPATVALSVAVGTVVSILAAMLPARRAALVPPVEAMREDPPTADRSLRLRALVGGVLLAAGVLAVALATSDRVDPAGTWLGVGAAATLVGVLLLAPVFARASLIVLAVPFVAGLRPLGGLARGNVTRNPRRTASTASALIIGMALVGATTVLAATAQASTRTIVESESTADLIVQSADRAVPPAAVEAIRELPSVGRADVVTQAAARVAGPGDDTPSAVTLAGLSDGAAGQTLDIEVTAGSLTDLDEGLAVQRSTAEASGWSLGDRLTLTTDGGTTSLPIRAVVDSRILGASLVLHEDRLADLVPEVQRSVGSVFVAAAPGVDPEDLRDDLVDAVAPYVILSVQTNDELATSLADQVGRVLVILYALLALSVVIAVLGIVNTLALAVIERTREIGLLRAVGLGRLQLAGTIAIESVLTALFGTAVGVAVGVSLASAMPFVFDDVGLSTLAVPWTQVLAMLALSVVVGVVAAIWPGVRAARLPVLEAIARE
jgi:putative ABC transport system permease protein